MRAPSVPLPARAVTITNISRPCDSYPDDTPVVPNPKGEKLTTMHDHLDSQDCVFLEKLHLATRVILDLGEDPAVLPDTLQSELFIFKDRVERALLRLPKD